jgi:CHAD domain-containing protein
VTERYRPHRHSPHCHPAIADYLDERRGHICALFAEVWEGCTADEGIELLGQMAARLGPEAARDILAQQLREYRHALHERTEECARLEGDVREARLQLQEVLDSRSFKAGNALMAFPRAIRRLFGR